MSNIKVNYNENDDISRTQTLTITELVGHKEVPKKNSTIFGWVKSCSAFTLTEKLYLILSLISLLISLILTIIRLIITKISSDDFTFALLLLWTTLFCVAYIIHGMFNENGYEIITFVVTNVIVLVYVIANFVSTQQTVLKIVRLTIITVISPVLIFYGIKFSRKYNKSGKFLYNIVGAKNDEQKICKLYYACIYLFWFDFQLYGSTLILWMKDGITIWTDSELIVMIFGLFINITFTITGLLSIRKENIALVFVCYLLSPFEIGIIIWNLLRNTTRDVFSSQLTISVYVSGLIEIFIRITAVIVLHFVKTHFGTGIKQKLFGKREEKAVALPQKQPNIDSPTQV